MKDIRKKTKTMNFITFQKKKGLYVQENSKLVNNNNSNLVSQINHELMSYGYVMTKELFDILSTKSVHYLQVVYSELTDGISTVVGKKSGYEPIYKNFPQEVKELSQLEFMINAVIHYWSNGTWRPNDQEQIERETSLELINFKEISLLTKDEMESIFNSVLYSGNSISSFDKQIIEYNIENSITPILLNKITFKETLAYVGQNLVDVDAVKILPTKNATDVLRIWSAYSNGDEGLKENTRFIKPNNRQKRLLLNTLEKCFNLEDSLKTYREKWLRVLFYLNPNTKKNTYNFPNISKYANALRNNPKSLETFNSKLERLISAKDVSVFDLLAKRQGVFMRRLDHLVRTFGEIAVVKFLNTKPTFMQLATTYNHFTDRAKNTGNRNAILANQNASQMVTYKEVEPLDEELVFSIKTALLNKLTEFSDDKNVYVDRKLYYTPLSLNNRGSELALDSKCIGETELFTGKNVLRMYVHWEGRSDIDLSAFAITTDSQVVKVGWNSYGATDGITYSGDNTGYADKNAEYIDIETNKVDNYEWIITEARIFSGPKTFKGYDGKAHIGWMETNKPEANTQWQPNKLSNARTLNSESIVSYLMAYHVPTKNIVYLDMSVGNNAVSSSSDAITMRTFLENFITLDDGKDTVNFDKLNKGQLLHLKYNVIDNKSDADIVFDEKTTDEEIMSLLTV